MIREEETVDRGKRRQCGNESERFRKEVCEERRFRRVEGWSGRPVAGTAVLADYLPRPRSLGKSQAFAEVRPRAGEHEEIAACQDRDLIPGPTELDPVGLHGWERMWPPGV